MRTNDSSLTFLYRLSIPLFSANLDPTSQTPR